jgi:hypothetical protein
MYLSQDPIGLLGGSNLYGYVKDTNSCVDTLGLKEVNAGDAGAFGNLKGEVGDGLTAHHIPQRALKYLPSNEGGAIVITRQEHEQT